MNANIALLSPRSPKNIATVMRSAQNLGVNTVMVIGGCIERKYQGNIHRFHHQMDTQDAMEHITVLYFKSLSDFLEHLPGRTTLVVVEMLPESQFLETYSHPDNATYLMGTEITGFSKAEIIEIRGYFEKLREPWPGVKVNVQEDRTAHLEFIKMDTPQSLNVGVCASIVMYDRHMKNF